MDWGLIAGAVTFLGVVGGLASSAFLVYDRVYRWRPLAFLQPRTDGLRLVVGNVSPEAIIIDEIGVRPDVLGIAQGTALRQIMSAALAPHYPTEGRSHTFTVLEPEERHEYRVLELKTFKTLPETARIRIRCRWRSTRSHWWASLVPRHAAIHTNVADVRALNQFGQDSEREIRGDR